jgi:hypothetical protein
MHLPLPHLNQTTLTIHQLHPCTRPSCTPSACVWSRVLEWSYAVVLDQFMYCGGVLRPMEALRRITTCSTRGMQHAQTVAVLVTALPLTASHSDSQAGL